MKEGEQIVYFIEQKETGKWYAGLWKLHSKIWTRNPHKAISFTDRKEAESLCETEDGEIVTEHIFIDSTQTFI